MNKEKNNIKNPIFFLMVLALPVAYHVFWYAFKYFGLQWHNSWNIPGFFIVAGSLPWPSPLMGHEISVVLKNNIGQEPRNLIQSFAVCFGFALNVTLVRAFVMWCLKKWRRK